jgi:dodecin
MPDSVYRVTEVIGVSSESWAQAARNAVETAAKTVRDLRVAEVLRQDLTIEDGKLRRVPRPSRDLVQVRLGRLVGSG